MYLLPKIHKGPCDVLGCPVILNCGTATEKVSEFLEYHLKPVMKGGKSYIKDINNFLEKLKKAGQVQLQQIWVGYTLVFLVILVLKQCMKK